MLRSVWSGEAGGGGSLAGRRPAAPELATSSVSASSGLGWQGCISLTVADGKQFGVPGFLPCALHPSDFCPPRALLPTPSVCCV